MVDKKVETAKLIARLAHAGQTDLHGEDYFSGHISSVAEAVVLPEEKVVAYLHDTLEDTQVTYEDIKMLFGKETADSVQRLTHIKGTPYKEYVQIIAEDPIARKVKLADLKNNMDESRWPEGRPEWLEERIRKKYVPAREILLKAGEQ